VTVRVKSVSGTRTLSALKGSGGHSKERHVRAFQIAALELERTRKGRELAAARGRIASLLERLREVDALIAQHQAELGVAAIGSVEAPAAAPPPRKRQTIRYG